MRGETDTETSRKTRFAAVTRRVWVAVWKIVIPGAALGLVFIILGETIKTSTEVGGALLEEIGTGFIVACISVFGYEYLRDVSGVIEAQEEFRGQIALLQQISERASDQALRDDLLRVLRNHKKLADAVAGTVQHAVQICTRSKDDSLEPLRGESDVLHSGACLNLLADLTHDSLSSIAEALNSFHDDVSRRYISPNGHEYRLPDSREIAGKVLSMLLSSLDSGDYYKSVANVLFYKNTLMSMFQRAAEVACARGVIIQRLFNVSNFEQGQLSPERFKECKGIIRAHLLLQKKIEARHPGGYQIRFYGGALSPFVNEQFNPADCPHLAAELPCSYFGLFCNKSRNSALLFFAKEPHRASRAWLAFRDLSDPTDSYFDRMWNVAESAPNPFAGEHFNNDWLDSTVLQLNGRTPDPGGAAVM